MYPQFALWRLPQGLWWEGWLVPFGSRPLRRFRVVMAYTGFPHDPVCWIVEPEISKRTWPCHRHLYSNGIVCPRLPGDRDWRYGRDDIGCYLDTVVLWIGCHVHLEEFGWWPGPEAPGSDAHGPPSCRSESGRLELGAQRFIQEKGLRALQELAPMKGPSPFILLPTPSALSLAG